MEPIVSPWLIYAVSVTGTLQVLFVVVATVSLVFSIMLGIGILTDDDDPKRFKYTASICIISGLLSALIPSTETAYKMLAASLITPDNLAGAEDHVFDLIDRLADIIAEKMKK